LKKAKKAGVNEVNERVKLLWGDRPALPSNTDMKKVKDQIARCKEMHKQILAYQEDQKNIAESDNGAMRVAEREIDRYQFGLELYHRSMHPDLELEDAIEGFKIVERDCNAFVKVKDQFVMKVIVCKLRGPDIEVFNQRFGEIIALNPKNLPVEVYQEVFIMIKVRHLCPLTYQATIEIVV